MTPVLPFLEDTKENVMGMVELAREAGARFIYPMFGVTLRDRQREYFTAGLTGFSRIWDFVNGMKNSTVNAIYAAVRKPGACTGFWGRNAAKPVFYTKCRI